MAGRFLTIEEAAAQLGRAADDVRQLVDQKKLFAVRDGTSLKFRADELERYLQEEADESGDESAASAGSIVLDTGSEGSGGLDISGLSLVGEAIETDSSAGPQTLVRGGADIELDDPVESGKDDSGVHIGGIEISGLDMSIVGLSLAGDSGAGGAAEARAGTGDPAQSLVLDDSLVLGDPIGSGASAAGSDLLASGTFDPAVLSGSIAGLGSSPSLAANQGDVAGSAASVSLNLDDAAATSDAALSGIGDVAAQSGATILGSGIDLGSGVSSDVGQSLSGAGGSGVLLEGGLSLEGDEVKPWDVDLGEFMGDLEEDPDAATVLGDGDEFNLGTGTLGENDASASVNVASESVGDSSFFPASTGTTESSFFGESVGAEGQLADPGSSMSLSQSGMYIGGLPDTKFSALQVTGLVCCSLLMLFGGLLAFDLVRTIGTPDDTALANPLLDGLAGVFGWRQ
jgi:excisionase family DNA binding protein